jgi:hypothetical protein
VIKYASTESELELIFDYGRDFKAWVALTVESAIIVSSGTLALPVRFIARHFVHVTGEFHAGAGSEVHILTEETFPDCTIPSSGMAPQLPISHPESKSTSVASIGNIELQFLPIEQPLSIFPNPCLEQFTVDGEPKGLFTVVDTQGAVILQGTKRTKQMVVDTRQWAPGIYHINLETPDGKTSLTITKVL